MKPVSTIEGSSYAPPLSRGNLTARLEWCQEYQNRDDNDWATVLFTDESQFESDLEMWSVQDMSREFTHTEAAQITLVSYNFLNAIIFLDI